MGPFCPALSFAGGGGWILQFSTWGPGLHIRNASGRRLQPFPCRTPLLVSQRICKKTMVLEGGRLAPQWGTAHCSGKAGETRTPIQHVPCTGRKH